MLAKLISSTKIVHGQLPDAEKADLLAWRLYLIIAIVLYSLWGKILLYFDPQHVESSWQRNLIIGVTAVVLVASYLSPWIMRRLQGIILLLAWIVTAHHFYIIYLNDFRPSVRMGAFVLTAAATVVFTTRRSLIVYSIYVLVLSGILTFLSPGQTPTSYLFFCGQTTLLFIQGVAAFVRMSMLDALKTVETKEFTQRWLKNDYISKMASLGKMSSGVAHEINNPLAVILGQADQIKELATRDDTVKKEFLIRSMEMIEKNSLRIGRVVNALRSFSKDSFQNVFLKTPLLEIIEETISLCKARIQRNNVTLTIPEYPKDLVVECQKTQIAHVLLNLLINSLDAVEKSKDPWINLEIREMGSDLEIAVADSGHGLSEEVCRQLFQPFFTTKEKGKAMGLGLSISKRLIEGHKGKIYLDRESKNTRFVFVIPRKHTATSEGARFAS